MPVVVDDQEKERNIPVIDLEKKYLIWTLIAIIKL